MKYFSMVKVLNGKNEEIKMTKTMKGRYKKRSELRRKIASYVGGLEIKVALHQPIHRDLDKIIELLWMLGKLDEFLHLEKVFAEVIK